MVNLVDVKCADCGNTHKRHPNAKVCPECAIIRRNTSRRKSDKNITLFDKLHRISWKRY